MTHPYIICLQASAASDCAVHGEVLLSSCRCKPWMVSICDGCGGMHAKCRQLDLASLIFIRLCRFIAGKRVCVEKIYH